MTLLGTLSFAHDLLKRTVQSSDTVIDATAGNGHDTLFLAKLVGEKGRVISCDIQEDAIKATKKRLVAANLLQQVSLYQIGHEQLDRVSELNEKKMTAAIFNLGYLPKGNKAITTTADTTIAAIELILKRLCRGGLIVLVIYHGHPEGKLEKEALLSYTATIPQEEAHVATYQFMNQKNNPPFILAIEKR